ncbi:Histone-lysine N-methyltransferase [Quillaja saponaria]|uniref:Histone-lysine N-methyltransferase n=1 Tax=Quillaja saponaria TaxID=32244 RepID=A0AAD7PL25_QUISA|nr:Histone-lysine N-methyltransferase [Quillaja saponaria]
MAPRRRPGKRGITRYDAALDAMRPYGFPEKLVMEKVKELLKVYGGDDGWVFVEEASYTLLIDTILAEKDDFLQDEARREDKSEASAATPTTGITEASGSNQGALDTLQQNSDALDSASQTNEVHACTSITNHEIDGKDFLQPADETEGGYQEGIKLDMGNQKIQVDNVFTQPSQPIDNLPLPPQRRKPCHGWINHDGDDEDLVYLTPSPLPKDIEKLLSERSVKRKRKTMWDVRPEDM